MAAPTGFEPAISCVTGRHVDPYTTEPCVKLLCGYTVGLRPSVSCLYATEAATIMTIAGTGLEPVTSGL